MQDLGCVVLFDLMVNLFSCLIISLTYSIAKVIGSNMQLDHKVICQFRFTCAERWAGLVPIEGDSQKRFCDVCKKPVYLTSSYEELAFNISAKRCVAIFLENAVDPPLEVMGDFGGLASSFNAAPDPFLLRPISELQLSETITVALKVQGDVRLVGDLIHCTPMQLEEGFGLNESQVSEIKEVLGSHGLMLGTNLSDWAIVSAEYR